MYLLLNLQQSQGECVWVGYCSQKMLRLINYMKHIPSTVFHLLTNKSPVYHLQAADDHDAVTVIQPLITERDQAVILQ